MVDLGCENAWRLKNKDFQKKKKRKNNTSSYDDAERQLGKG